MAEDDVGAHFQRLVGVGVFIAPDKEAADDGGQDAGRGQHQGEEGAGAGKGTLDGDAQRQRGDQRAHIGLEEVGAHAGHVAHVVAHVVGDDGGVPGVILRNAGLHLAHQVGAHVSRLGIDAAAHTGEKRDGGSTQRKAGEDGDVAGEGIDGGAAQKTQTHHAHAHNAAAGEGDAQRLVHAAALGGGRGADVGLGGNVHAHIPCAHGENRAHKETNSGCPADEKPNQHKQNRHKNYKNPIFRK